MSGDRSDPRLEAHAPLGSRTTYRVGGSVELLARVGSLAELEGVGELLQVSQLPLHVVGNGSNLLVADGEVAVAVVQLDGAFAELTWHDEGDHVVVLAGGGMDLPVAARRLAAAGVAGFEWAVGVPGTFGGAVVMNAGGHGSDMAASVRRVTVWRNGAVQNLFPADLAFDYRHSSLQPGTIVLEVELTLRHGDSASSRSEVGDIVRWRREHQPGGANAGSVFRNPPGDSAGRLIEVAGGKGLRHGTAHVSTKHANFIIADAGGRAHDVYDLIGEVRDLVHETSGVWLRPEHHFIGFEELT